MCVPGANVYWQIKMFSNRPLIGGFSDLLCAVISQLRFSGPPGIAEFLYLHPELQGHQENTIKVLVGCETWSTRHPEERSLE